MQYNKRTNTTCVTNQLTNPLAELFSARNDDYSFKRRPFSLKNMAFRRLKDGLLRYERMPFASVQEAGENRK